MVSSSGMLKRRGTALLCFILSVCLHAAGKEELQKKIVAFGEELGRELGCTTIRFDTSEFNQLAYSIYTGLGYAVVGEILAYTSESMAKFPVLL